MIKNVLEEFIKKMTTPGTVSISFFPALNASLNALSTIFLIAGFVFIKKKKVFAHRLCMLSAFGFSILFLISYLYYHVHAGVVYYKGSKLGKMIYFFILTTHTILAAVVPILAVITLSFAFRGIFEKHKKIAKITLPIWLYVSITGVLVYWLLFH
jgi:uncharacterized membrane protein YozB (DUF420 family)